MTATIQNPTKILRKRFGEFLKIRREELGMTQASAAALLDFGWPAMVSQVERGVSSFPAHDLRLWSEVLQLAPEDLAKKWLYYLEPSVFHCLYQKDPYAIERLPHPERTINSAPGRPALRAVPKN